MARASVARAWRRLHRRKISHARLFQGKAEFLIRDVIPPGGLHRLYVNFPDPWPKERHRNRRLLTSPFLALLSTRLKFEGVLRFTTDDQAYFDDVVQLVKKCGLYAASMPPPLPAALQTKYASKWSAQRRPMYHLRLSKIASSPKTFLPAVTRTPMHHAFLCGPLPQPEDFEPFRHAFPGGQVIVLGLMQRISSGELLFEVRLEEADLTQDILVEAKPSGSNTLVRVSTWGQPLSTEGTRQAVIAIERWLMNRGMHTPTAYY